LAHANVREGSRSETAFDRSQRRAATAVVPLPDD
jgi:hypothetical protein